jgi:uncharacterized protein (DUF169 family)
MTTTELIAGTARLREMIGLRHEPLAFYYSDTAPQGFQPGPERRGCLIALLSRARRGETVFFDQDTTGCPGGSTYLGFCEARPEIDAFVSTGIPGVMEGEHYKQSPELVRAFREAHPPLPAPARYAVFTPVSALAAGETPLVVLCFAGPDELCGLVGLAGYARADDAILSPFGSGCGVLISRALYEAQNPQPRGILGMFDPSARPCVAADELSFSAPRALWEEMLSHAEESFLQTKTWATLRRRIAKTAAPGQPEECAG